MSVRYTHGSWHSATRAGKTPCERKIHENALKKEQIATHVSRMVLRLHLFWHVWKFLETNVIKTSRNTHAHTHTHAGESLHSHTQTQTYTHTDWKGLLLAWAFWRVFRVFRVVFSNFGFALMVRFCVLAST